MLSSRQLPNEPQSLYSSRVIDAFISSRLPALFAKVLQPHHDILTVKYFTARVSGTAADPLTPQRQDVYLRALRRYRTEIEAYFGHFLSHRVRAPLAEPAGDRRTAEVIRTEEKRLRRRSRRAPAKRIRHQPECT